ncbi:ZIP family metal transporter [Oscillibacter valericigenes]|uniref:ZIP family metal transporter n=1 Tax=Oscillibacter valericigenes TaxID=351091 RepID=UPI001F40453E|nr:ZIP family metal transporter [Oscillibacter valericigenes]MCF2665088.1 ZIP family metal transporter [Oscillibacter valericigenes]
MLQRELLYAALGTGFTCLATVLGAGMVFFFKKEMSHTMQKVFLGFAAGVMIAASVWSLLIPAMEMAESRGQSVILPVGGGFVLGGLFLMALDRLLPHLHIGSDEAEGLPAHWKRTTMIVLAVTLHNIPEGMAVGLSFSVAAREGGALAGAVALALGMGLQNFPEGAAVSLPMKSQGVSRKKAFLCGAASGIVEPIFGLLTVLVAGSVAGIMPWVLSFAAGAMIYVVVEELIPEAQLGEHSHAGTASVMAGFLVMMLLDVLLG